jgi:hypothetical protein
VSQLYLEYSHLSQKVNQTWPTVLSLSKWIRLGPQFSPSPSESELAPSSLPLQVDQSWPTVLSLQVDQILPSVFSLSNWIRFGPQFSLWPNEAEGECNQSVLVDTVLPRPHTSLYTSPSLPPPPAEVQLFSIENPSPENRRGCGGLQARA